MSLLEEAVAITNPNYVKNFCRPGEPDECKYIMGDAGYCAKSTQYQPAIDERVVGRQTNCTGIHNFQPL